MHRSRPAITESMLVLSCLQCGASFHADKIAVAYEVGKCVYRCPNDGLDLIRVGVGEMGEGGGDIEFEHGSAQVRLAGVDIDFMEFINRDDSN
jgi:hypothetical protein